MTPSDFIAELRMIISSLVAKKATGKQIIAVDMNQGGIGSFKIFSTVKTPKDGALFISKHGTEVLTEIH